MALDQGHRIRTPSDHCRQKRTRSGIRDPSRSQNTAFKGCGPGENIQQLSDLTPSTFLATLTKLGDIDNPANPAERRRRTSARRCRIPTFRSILSPELRHQPRTFPTELRCTDVKS